MIIVRLMGGLGNQMFQYAAGKRLATKHRTELKLDLTWLTKLQSPEAPAWRDYELDAFEFKPHLATRPDLGRVVLPPHTWKRRLIRKMNTPIMPIIEPLSGDFMPEVLDAGDNVYLEGFWQTEKYFADQAKVIRQDFTFKNDISAENKRVLKQIKGSNAISLHVRRGDYSNHAEINAIHGLTGLDYYKAAVAKMSKNVKDPTFFVFSDDPGWCKKNLKLNAPSVYVDHNTKGADDMMLMSNCQHHIIANSTFSWWGAWLNASKSKVVIAPKRWFNSPDLDSEKVVPSSWIRL